MNWLAFNTAKKPLNDVNVRKAIAMTIDKKFISKALHGGFSQPADGPIVASSPFAIPDVITYPLYLIHQNIGYMLFNALYPAVSPHALLWGTVVLVGVGARLLNTQVEGRAAKPLKRALARVAG